MATASQREFFYSAGLLALVFACYSNALSCGFAFDDRRGIVKNEDLRPNSSIFNLFFNDFWGTPMHEAESHKSYRPLCVLTFRLNYALGELNPWGYHLLNVVLHWAVCVLFLKAAKKIIDEESSVNASLLFAVHAVHTEAVTGVVGRAELLSSIFMLLSFMAYVKAAEANSTTDWKYMSWSALLIVMATASKEQGITVAGICCIYEIFYVQKIRLHTAVKKATENHFTIIPRTIMMNHNSKAKDKGVKGARQPQGTSTSPDQTSNGKFSLNLSFIRNFLYLYVQFSHKAFMQHPTSRGSKTSRSSSPNSQALWRAAPRLGFLIASSGLLLWGRMIIMGAKLPSFDRFDNPAALSPFQTRRLTHLYLLPVNAWLLLCPSTLLCDWTMGTIPLVTSLSDPRNLATLLLVTCLFLLVLYAVFAEEKISCQLIMALSFLVLPFLPASNLFFPVGFVVAERVLYTPSMGYCLLVAIAMERLQANRRSMRYVVGVIFAIILLLHAGKTIQRNPDWESEYSLFSSALKVTQNNAKLWNNVGHALEAEDRWEDAFIYYNNAATVQPDDIGSWINIGRVNRLLGKPDEAEAGYRRAVKLMPQPRTGKKITPKYLSVYLNLAAIIQQNKSRFIDAEELYRMVIRSQPNFAAYVHLAQIMVKKDQFDEAESLYQKATQLEPPTPDLLYNLAIIAIQKEQETKAHRHFDEALEIDPQHRISLFRSALYIHESGNAARRTIAIKRLKKLLEIDPPSVQLYSTLALTFMDDEDTSAALHYYQKALEIRPSDYQALFNTAKIHFEEERPLQAKPYLETLLKHHPNHTEIVRSMLLLGEILLNSLQDEVQSQQLFQRIVDLDSSNVQAQHNLCVIQVRRDLLEEAEQCLLDILERAPHAEDTQATLNSVRQKMKERSSVQQVMESDKDSDVN
ncbi:protein O-mannosyl-transferase TMTC3-like [Strongylocentrotus purpuratus]|uniref:dolichyl-phosphate-mannose--protein mannosyltransferase n=1 Tax=Strongylocentrotus purpuratus TaxID=7668 RepID=A0A7M7P5E1_STRPU|nr:protein O-mannosyl-transferase TMTC3-like [Strongylocentrotus purpuratus]